MRLRNIRISGFRAFAQEVYIDLDANAVIVVGDNGSGKTSLFDAILWGLTGTVPRVAVSEDIISKYSRSGEARVEIQLTGPSDEALTVTRSFDGSKQRFSLDQDGSKLRDASASIRLIQLLSAGLLADERALANAFTRSVYLEQDRVRDFIESDSDADRFRTINELIGTGAVTEFQMQLERARTAWNRATSTIRQDADKARGRLRDLEQRVDTLPREETLPANLLLEWSGFWESLEQLSPSKRPVPELDSSEAALAVESSIQRVEGLIRATDRLLEQLLALAAEVDALGDDLEFDELRQRAELEALRAEADSASQAYEVEVSRIAALRDDALNRLSRDEEIRSLASLALRLLGERCPVCDQPYDREATAARLEGISKLEHVDTSFPAVAADLQERIARSSRELEAATRTFATTLARRNRIDERLAQVGIALSSQGLTGELERKINDTRAEVNDLMVVRERAESLALRLSYRTAEIQNSQLRKDIQVLQDEVGLLDQDCASRDRSGVFAQELIGAMRDVGIDLVQHQLTQLAPMLQRIFASMDPHPSFRVVSLLARMSYGHGRLDARLEDSASQVVTDRPQAILSSSQSNALAVSLFLTLNLVGSALPLQLLMIDDPMQSLDDIHRLGLVDLLRRTKTHRQLIVSTHDWRAAELLMKKLRPVDGEERTRVWEFTSWTRLGPRVNDRVVDADPVQLRIAM